MSKAFSSKRRSECSPTSINTSPQIFGIAIIIFVVLLVVSIMSLCNQANELRSAQTAVSELVAINEGLVAELADAKAKLAMPVYVEVVYDPDETIHQPADPTATRLQWQLGSYDNFESQLHAGAMSLVAPIDLMNYRVLQPGGGDMIGNTDLLPAVVKHAFDQRQELFDEVDNSGFIDR